MNVARRTLRAYLVAALLFLAAAGLMLLLARSEPPKRAQRQAQPAGEVLKAPREVQGVPCTGPLRVAADGRLISCTLARAHAFGSLLLPARSEILMHRDGSGVVKLPSDTRLEGHLCRSNAYGDFSAGFYSTGLLKWCYLVDDETIEGVPCRHGSFWAEITGDLMVEFHPNGRLAGCRLAAAVTLAGDRHAKGERIALDTEGKVLRGANPGK
jgi:hypothetical protein